MPGYPEKLNYYRCAFFRIEELVPRATYHDLGDTAWTLFDYRILYTIDRLREFFGTSLIVNDWVWEGNHQYRGWRPGTWKPDQRSVGGIYSQHKFGRAIDLVSSKVAAEEMRLRIMERNRLFPFITYMEDEVSWLHIDCRNANVSRIHLFKP